MKPETHKTCPSVRSSVRCLRLVMACASISAWCFAAGTLAGQETGADKDISLENGNIAFVPANSGQFRLTNRLTGKTYSGRESSFEVQIETGGKAARITGADFALCKITSPATGSLKINSDTVVGIERP